VFGIALGERAAADATPMHALFRDFCKKEELTMTQLAQLTGRSAGDIHAQLEGQWPMIPDSARHILQGIEKALELKKRIGPQGNAQCGAQR
jgi:hypothetical protein